MFQQRVADCGASFAGECGIDGISSVSAFLEDSALAEYFDLLAMSIPQG
jgi:hypothetical protein